MTDTSLFGIIIQRESLGGTCNGRFLIPCFNLTKSYQAQVYMKYIPNLSMQEYIILISESGVTKQKPPSTELQWEAVYNKQESKSRF